MNDNPNNGTNGNSSDVGKSDGQGGFAQHPGFSGESARGDDYWRGTYGSAEYQPPSYGDPDRNARRALARQAEYRRDHIAAGLLAIFLGSFGVHKFYLGYNQAAFIMLATTVLGSLITFGLAAAVMEVIAIIEGVLYLTKSQTEFDELYVHNVREWF